jgi:predicted hotdog family 3-hydroxylacyl-ACP dehydratase
MRKTESREDTVTVEQFKEAVANFWAILSLGQVEQPVRLGMVLGLQHVAALPGISHLEPDLPALVDLGWCAPVVDGLGRPCE